MRCLSLLDFFFEEVGILYFFISGALDLVAPSSRGSVSYIFFCLLFLSATPVFYVSPASSGALYREHTALMLLVYFLAIFFLFSHNLFFLIFFYESLIIPIFFILRGYSHYYRRTQAAFFILIWALLGSFFLLLGFFIVSYWGTTYTGAVSTIVSMHSEWVLVLFLLGFSVKVPLWPFHYWISRAHAEGPTNMSIFLSGVLVKLSIYGILRVFDVFLLKTSLSFFYFLAVIGVIDSTLKMLIQIDSKVVVAFSTTVQMNFILFILFSKTSTGDVPLLLGLVNHFITASILFFTCDVILVRFNTREFFFLAGLHYFLPIFSFFLLLGIVNQINFPGFLGFIFDVAFVVDVFPTSVASSGLLFFFLFGIEHLYILFFFLKIAFGSSTSFKYFLLRDLGFTEVGLYFYLISISAFFGIFPNLVWILLFA